MKKSSLRLALSKAVVRKLQNAELPEIRGGLSGGKTTDCSGTCSCIPTDPTYSNQCTHVTTYTTGIA